MRPDALGLITAYLRESGDVVLPQLIAREAELAKFARAAADAGADFEHVLLEIAPADSVARFEGRLDAPHSGAVRGLVAADGGPEAVVTAYVAALRDLPGGRRLDAADDIETTYAALVAMLDR